MTQNLQTAAEQYAEAGWRVFPVHPTTKRPLTRHGHLDASSDLRQVLAWSGYWEHQGASIGTPTGDGFLVIDVDPRNGGEVPIWAPATRTVRTQSGGLHLHYAIDEDIKSRAGLFAPGVDSKCKGGYVLLPPSAGYEWVDPKVHRAKLSKAWLERHFNAQVVTGGTSNARRLPAAEWRRGIIHDQVVAWAAWAAGPGISADEKEVREFVWFMVSQAKEMGCQIDNARDHINTAISWVLERERAKTQLGGPSLD